MTRNVCAATSGCGAVVNVGQCNILRMKQLAAYFMTLALGAVFTSVACADLINFDNLSPRPLDQIPRPYGGLIFSASPYNGTESSNPEQPGALEIIAYFPSAVRASPRGFMPTCRLVAAGVLYGRSAERRHSMSRTKCPVPCFPDSSALP